ncbi:MAG: hypothetical protein QOJ90_1148 [Actinomycetota bacterium]|nr:hypothetical protein [Actinomycetota bacterium]
MDGSTLVTLLIAGVFLVCLVGYLVLKGRDPLPPARDEEPQRHEERLKPWQNPEELRRGGKGRL